jgi:hypothetical protein
MSWDIFVQDFPVEAKTIEEISPNFEPRPVGQRAQIIECIRTVVPDADFSDPSWGSVEMPECSMEIDLGESEEVLDFAFHVHGGEMAPGVVLKILRRLNLRAIDNGTGQFLDEATAVLGFEAWREYRDQALATSKMN